jgi:O-succinylbenzoate synthase
LSASARYFHADVTAPFELEDGRLRVPSGPGLGVDPLPERLAELTTSVEVVRP